MCVVEDVEESDNDGDGGERKGEHGDMMARKKERPGFGSRGVAKAAVSWCRRKPRAQPVQLASQNLSLVLLGSARLSMLLLSYYRGPGARQLVFSMAAPLVPLRCFRV